MKSNSFRLRIISVILSIMLVIALMPAGICAQSSNSAASQQELLTGGEEDSCNWVSTWAMAEEKCDVNADRMPQMNLKGTTVRQAVRITDSSDTFRLTFSNEFGKKDVAVGSLHIAKQEKPGSNHIVSGTDTVVTVDGKTGFTIKAGETVTTDPVYFPAEALDILAVSMYFDEAPTSDITGHRGARATTFQTSGNKVSDLQWDSGQVKTTTSWFFLCDIAADVPGGKAVVCFGDSITDGYGTDASYLGRNPDSYTRWTDYFALRLKENPGTENISVLNEGIGANGMLGSYPTQSGRDRFARDLLQHDNVGYVIILFGVNDLEKLQDTGKYSSLKTEYEKMIALAHQNGIKVYIAPILPFGTSSYYSKASEQVRQMLNNWLRSTDSGADGIIDFEGAVADPDNPVNIAEKYTHSDGLHPYDGYDVMAEAIDLTLFEDSKNNCTVTFSVKGMEKKSITVESGTVTGTECLSGMYKINHATVEWDKVATELLEKPVEKDFEVTGTIVPDCDGSALRLSYSGESGTGKSGADIHSPVKFSLSNFMNVDYSVNAVVGIYDVNNKLISAYSKEVDVEAESGTDFTVNIGDYPEGSKIKVFIPLWGRGFVPVCDAVQYDFVPPELKTE